MIVIHKPKFYGNNPENRCIGLAEWRVRNEGVITQVKIDYKTKDRRDLYPNVLYMSSSEIAKYPRNDREIPGQILYIIPLKDFKVVDPILKHLANENAKTEVVTKKTDKQLELL